MNRVLWAAGVFFLAISVSAAPWRFSNPRPHGNNVLDMLFLDGVVWQVGERGSIYTSSDLDLWVRHESGTRKSLRSITNFRTNVYISGEEGLILTAQSPESVTSRQLPTTNWLEGIAASTSVIVAVGDNGAIYSSPDGVEWNRRGSFSTWLRSVAHGGDQFVAVGEEGFIATSPNGLSWDRQNSGTTAHLNKVAWLNGRFWIVGEGGTVLTNSSTTTFVPVTVGVTNTLFTISANTNEIVIAGDGIVLRSSVDGSSWTQESDAGSPLLAPMWPYYSSLWDGRLFLLSGRTGMLVEGFRTNSTAPLNWYSTFQPTRSWLWSVARTAEFFTAVGVNGTIVTSDDGVAWEREVVPAAVRTSLLLGVGGNSNLVVAAGNAGTILLSQNILTNVISTNLLGDLVTNVVSLLGVRWEYIPPGVTNDLQGVAVTHDQIIVTGGNGTILRSVGTELGTVWLPAISGLTNFLSGVTAWPNGFVAVGSGGAILTSANGLLWERQNSKTTGWVYSVRYLGGQLVAVGESGLLLTSNDGENWQSHQSGTTEWLNDVTFAQGTWYVAGGNGTLVTSTDGSTWQSEVAITAKSLYGIATDSERIVAVGLEGVILRRSLQTITTPVHITSYDYAVFSDLFLFSGIVDQRFVLEKSDSILGPWIPAVALEFPDETGTLLYELENDGAPMQFFRTRLL